MRVRILEIDQNTGAETPQDEAELIDCFGDGRGNLEYLQAVDALVHGVGHYYIGGGAAPLFLLFNAENPT